MGLLTAPLTYKPDGPLVLNPDSSRSAGLVFSVWLNETGGSAIDLVAGAKGTVVGTVTRTAARSVRAAKFAANATFNFGNLAILKLGTTDFTVAIRYYDDSTSRATGDVTGKITSTFSWLAYVNSGNQSLDFKFSSDGGASTNNGCSLFSAGGGLNTLKGKVIDWITTHNLATKTVVGKCFGDGQDLGHGVATGTVTYTGTFNTNNDNAGVGSRGGTGGGGDGSFTGGQLLDIQIWSRVLSAQEQIDHANRHYEMLMPPRQFSMLLAAQAAAAGGASVTYPQLERFRPRGLTRGLAA